MTDIAQAILEIKSDEQVSVSHEDINTIIWHTGNLTNITNQQILDKQAELQVEFDAEQIAKPLRLASAKTKLEGLGLTTEEVKEAFGI